MIGSMKERAPYRLLVPLFAIACALFVSVQLGWLHSRQPEYIDPLDFTNSDFKPEDPMNLAQRQPTACGLHGNDMRIEVVPIYYGTPSSMFRDENGKRYLALGEIDPDIRQAHFPHSQHEHWGGCVVSNLSPKTAKIRICFDCEQAEQKWHEEHPQESQ